MHNTGHLPHACKFKTAICHHCNKKGPIKKACRSMHKQKKTNTKRFGHKKAVNASNDSNTDNCIASLEFEMNNIETSKDVIWVTPVVEGKQLKMELDTGSPVSVITKPDLTKHFGNLELTEANITLKTYSVENIKPIGCSI